MSISIGDWTFNYVSYDADADVLYLSLDTPVAGVGEETPEGHIARFDQDGRFTGVTLIGVGAMIEAREPIAITLPHRTEVDGHDLELALA